MRGYKFLMDKANLHKVEVIEWFTGKLYPNQIKLDKGGIAKVKSCSGADYIVYAIDGGLGCSCPWGQWGADGHRSFCSHTLAVLGHVLQYAGFDVSVFSLGCYGPDCYELWDDAVVQIQDNFPESRKIFGYDAVVLFVLESLK